MALSESRGVHALVPKIGAASLALAPKLFGGVTKTLPVEQERALAAAAKRFEGSDAGRVARNVRRAWQEPTHRMTLFLG